MVAIPPSFVETSRRTVKAGMQEAIPISSTITDPLEAAAAATSMGNTFGYVAVEPLGTGDDDMPRLAAIMDTVAGKYKLVLLPGTWNIKSTSINNGIPTGMPSNLHVECVPGVIFDMTLPMFGSWKDRVAFMACWGDGSGAEDTDLHSGSTIGLAELQTHGYITPDQWIAVGTAAVHRVAHYYVRDCVTGVIEAGDAGNACSAWTLAGITLANTDSGILYWNLTGNGVDTTITLYSDAAKTVQVATGALGGIGGGLIWIREVGGSGLSGTVTVTVDPADDTDVGNTLTTGLNVGGYWTISLDRAVMFNFITGDAVAPVSSIPENIRWDCNGAIFTGRAMHSFAFFASRSCYISGARFITNSGPFIESVGVHFNDGCWNCHAYDFVVELVPSMIMGGIYGPKIQSCEQCSFERVTVNNIGSYGIVINDSINASVIDAIIENCADNGIIVSSSHPMTTDARECQIIRCTVRRSAYGITVSDGFGHHFKNISIQNCAYGMGLGLATYNLNLDDIKISECSNGGLQILDATDANINNILCSGTGGFGFDIQADCELHNIKSDSNDGYELSISGTVNRVLIDGFDLDAGTVDKPFVIFQNSSGSILDLRNGHINIYDGNQGIHTSASGTIIRQNVVVTSGGTVASNKSYVGDTGTTLIDRDGVVDPWGTDLAGTATANSGTFTSDGANPTTVTLATVQTNSRLEVETTAGIPVPITAPTINAGVSVIFATMTAGTYRWRMT